MRSIWNGNESFIDGSEQEIYIDRDDKVRRVKNQALKIYVTTIAANEREERILRRNLKAIEGQQHHRISKLKRQIKEAELQREKQLARMRSVVKYGEDWASKEHQTAPASIYRTRTTCRERRSIASRVDTTNIGRLNSLTPMRGDVKVDEGGALSDNRDENHTGKRRGSERLDASVKYTEAEVKNLKVSFAGKRGEESKTSRRKLFPEIEDDPYLVMERRRRRWKRRRLREKRMKEVNSVLEKKLNELSLKEKKKDVNKK